MTNEATLTSDWARVFFRNYVGVPFGIEFKVVKAPDKSLSFSSFQDHQIPNLAKTANKGIWHKIPDLGVQNPYDGIYIRGEAYVGIFWYVPRKLKICTMIKVQDFTSFMLTCGKKSIKQDEAENISEFVVKM